MEVSPTAKDTIHGGLPETLESVSREIEIWAKDPNEPPVYWLNGLAGTGKSAIARTIAERLDANGWTVAFFHCSRGGKDQSDIRMIIPTLAIQLAWAHPEIWSELARNLSIYLGLIRDLSPDQQMVEFIIRPLRRTGIQKTVIVIDGLDECRNECRHCGHECGDDCIHVCGCKCRVQKQLIPEFLSILGERKSEIQACGLKFLITSRPEKAVRRSFRLLDDLKTIGLPSIVPCQERSLRHRTKQLTYNYLSRIRPHVERMSRVGGISME